MQGVRRWIRSAGSTGQAGLSAAVTGKTLVVAPCRKTGTVAGRETQRAWTGDGVSDRALRAATVGDTGGLPARSVALYARWWQLETWLRELVYVELRALFGRAWGDAVAAATGRQTQDAAFTHMAGADSDNPLAYLDYSQLIEIVGRHWDQFEYALLRRSSWEGRQEELLRIRHRIGHLR